VRPRAAALEAQIAKQQAAQLATRAAARATDAATKVGDTVGDSALTAKIKSKMVLDDEVAARGIDVDTSGTIVTLTGVVRSAVERDRAVQLARETKGVTKVIDKLRVRES
jgi:hyperosmotically inducible protein